jgi:DNA mismatch repair protein MutL
MKIRVLDDSTINKIAAGEVVDRPASVVRELVDNAIDAGATEISVFLEAGGRTLIRVIDNGCGLSKDDALLAFERHATSKISSVEDLQTISSYGFRGEALASIAAVSRVELKTRTNSSEVATSVVIDGGVLRDVQEVRGAVGTDIAIHRLFFNTPVRRKFLRQPSSELRRVKTWVQHCALGNPAVVFRLVADGAEVLKLARAESMIERGQSIWPGGISVFPDDSDGAKVDSQWGRVEGIIGHPSMVTADSSEFVFLVNRRVVTDRALLKAVREGFLSTLKDREYPIGFLSLSIDPSLVDINVHPQKSEVRFVAPGEVYRIVRDSVLRTLNACKKPAPVSYLTETATGGHAILNIEETRYFEPARAVSQQISEVRELFPRYDAVPQPLMFGNSDLSRIDSEAVSMVSHGEQSIRSIPAVASAMNQNRGEEDNAICFSDLMYIGQLFGCYLLCEQPARLGVASFVVVDMHAAHERYNFNLVRNKFFENGFPCQQLLIPLSVRVGEDGLSRLEEHVHTLGAFGIILEPFGSDTVLVRGTPTIVGEGQLEALVRDVAQCELELMAGDRVREVVDKVSARIACHASIRSGRRMEEVEVKALFAALDTADFSMACPHGRPIVVRFAEPTIERWFGRDR